MSRMMIYASPKSMAFMYLQFGFFMAFAHVCNNGARISLNDNKNVRSNAQNMGAIDGGTFTNCTL
jgi:hypothetical protein